MKLLILMITLLFSFTSMAISVGDDVEATPNINDPILLKPSASKEKGDAAYLNPADGNAYHTNEYVDPNVCATCDAKARINNILLGSDPKPYDFNSKTNPDGTPKKTVQPTK